MFLFVEWNEQNASTTFAEAEQAATPTSTKEYNDNPEASSSSFQESLPTINNNTVGLSEMVAQRSETTSLSNSVLSITVDSKGADIVGATLLKYYPSKEDTENNIDLMYVNNPVFEFHRLQSGLLSSSGGSTRSRSGTRCGGWRTRTRRTSGRRTASTPNSSPRASCAAPTPCPPAACAPSTRAACGKRRPSKSCTGLGARGRRPSARRCTRHAPSPTLLTR